MENANNKINLIGTVTTEPEFSHEVLGEGFYKFYIKCSRKSTSVDTLPVLVSDRFPCFKDIKTGSFVEITGDIRSYNKHTEEKNKLILTVFARSISVVEDVENAVDYCEYNNNATLEGYICKPPVYRTTPNGRDIADVMIAVNRPYSKSDYIPCIAWGRNARFVGGLEVGDKIAVTGRFQSREYEKKIGNEVETRTAYELSVAKIGIIAESEE